MKGLLLFVLVAFSFHLFGSVLNIEDLLLSNVRIFVDSSNAGGTEDGNSWATAFSDFQDAIDAAGENDTIWVAKGTYVPTRDTSGIDNDRSNTFFLDKNLIILGGFSGNETHISQRDWLLNKTVLSGDRGVNGELADNCYHVLWMQHLDSLSCFDGFRITKGNADGSSGLEKSGGGILMISDGNGERNDPAINNCEITQNYAEEYGGGLYSSVTNHATSTPSFKNLKISNNSGGNDSRGGGGYFFLEVGENRPYFSHCVIEMNDSRRGGGLMFNAHNGNDTDTIGPVMEDCTIRSNEVSREGGGVYLEVINNGNIVASFIRTNISENDGLWGGAVAVNATRGVYADVRIENSEIQGNTASSSGAGVYIIAPTMAASPTYVEVALINTLVSGNRTNSSGGILHMNRSNNFTAVMKLVLLNSTLAANSNFGEGIISLDTFSTTIVEITNSLIWGNRDNRLTDTTRANLVHSLIEGTTSSGIGMLNGIDSLNDPFFKAPFHFEDAPKVGGNFRPAPCSQVINAGVNDSIPTGLNTDLDSLPRIQLGEVDLGPYENGELDSLDFECQDITLSLVDGEYAFDDFDFRRVLANGSLCYSLTQGPGTFFCEDLNSSPLAVELIGTHTSGTRDTCNILVTINNDSIECCALGDTSGSAYIKSVKVESALRIIEQQSGDDGGYADFMSDDLLVGPSDSLYITICGTSQAPDSIRYYRVWVDTNDNDMFEAHELIFQDSSSGPVSGWYHRTGVIFGTQSMRVAMKIGGYPEVCGAFIGGEVEDYDLKYSPCRSNILIEDRNVSGTFQAEETITTMGNVTLLGHTSFLTEEAFLGKGFEVPPGYSFEVVLTPCDD